ncbi:MAG: OmpA family protein [Bacteroidia bacterium]
MKFFFTKRTTIFFLIGFFTSTTTSAQKNLEKGDKLFDMNQFTEAIRYYDLEVKARNSKTLDQAMLKLANCYRITGEFEKAEATYKTLLKKKKKDPKAILNYAISLKSSAKYAEAAAQFKEYLKANPLDPMGEMYLQSCDLAQVWLDETIGKEVRNVEKLNSELGDFAPVLTSQGQLVYTSSKPGGTQALISFDGGNEIHRLDLYSLDVNDIDEKPKTDIRNMKEFNSPLHEGPATFSKDGTELYFTRTINGKKDKHTNKVLNTLQVFYCKKDSTGHWSKPQSAFSFNSKDYSVGQPSLSPDGKTIYYMSDMPGGKGGTDIYYSTREKDKSWSAPKKIEGDVNTFGHELFPYISDDGVLYFSSDAHPGMGQLDIFSSEYDNGKWVNVTNLKPPINSIANDFGLALDGKNKRGFFSSDRFNGKGAEDIYSFSDPIPLKLSIDSDTIRFADKSIYDGIKYKLVNEADKSEQVLEPFNGVYSVKLAELQKYTLVAKKNGFPYNKISLSLSRDTLGNYLEARVKPGLHSIQVDGHLRSSLIPDSLRIKYGEMPVQDVAVSLIDSSTTVEKELAAKRTGAFGFEEVLNANESYTVIAKIEVPKDPPDPIVKCKGIVMYNGAPLANASVQLLEDGKLTERFQTGEKGNFDFELDLNKNYTIAGNKLGFDTASVSFITDANDAKNGMFRTIRLDSLGSIRLNGTVRNAIAGLGNVQLTIREGSKVVAELRSASDGKFNGSLLPGHEYTITATAGGYFQKEVALSTKTLNKGETLTTDILLDSIKVNAVVELRNLYYDYDKPDVQFKSLPALDKLVEFMRTNPTVKIELAANTDSRGNPDYNLRLSQARAQYAKDYLTLEDISPDRVVPVGYGKTKPLIANAKSEQEHQINRRTEIRILQN